MLSNLIIITFILFVSASYSQNNLFKSHPYAALGTSEALTASASFGDIDGDGDLDIIVANGVLGFVFCLAQSRQEHACQNGNNGNNDQKFNEGKCPLAICRDSANQLSVV